MSEFNCLARTFVLSALLFHTFYPIRPNFRKWFVSHNIEPLSLRFLFGVMMNMLAMRYFFLRLETEELISEIGSHNILQEASEL